LIDLFLFLVVSLVRFVSLVISFFDFLFSRNCLGLLLLYILVYC